MRVGMRSGEELEWEIWPLKAELSFKLDNLQGTESPCDV